MAITSKDINPAQLDQELGGHGLIFDFNDEKNKVVKAADGSSVTEAQIEAAIAAHVAQPSAQKVQQLNREQGIAKLKELGFTDEQINALLS
jgi:hypothetical protein